MTVSTHRSDIFALANDIVERDAAHDPRFATASGIAGYDHLLPDFSLARVPGEVAFLTETLATLGDLVPSDDIDDVAQRVMTERLQARLALMTSGEATRTFSIITSPVGEVRQVFEIMDTSDAAVVEARLRQVRPALDTWKTTLEELRATSALPAVRHVQGVAEQARQYGAGSYVEFVTRTYGTPSAALLDAARDADVANEELAQWLEDGLVASAPTVDAVGEERYAQWATYFTGASLDLHELYQWGYEDLRRIVARMEAIATELTPSATSLVEAKAQLDADPARIIVGTDALLEKMVSFTQGAIEAMDGVYFDIDPRIRTCEARLAPDGGALAPYYIAPSEDLSRPGITWFPTNGETEFRWWHHASTWYHEGVPGHHLQCAVSVIERDRQSRFHRLEAWTSGYGEGWALYAERLMDELGFFTDRADELGHLAGQALRAARVVVDIGLHLQLPVPEGFWPLDGLGDCSGQRWTAEMAVATLRQLALESDDRSVSEVDRYLGWPGQAISYKVGERVWLRAREEAQSRLGDSFSIRRFHNYALMLGPMGLDPFEEEMRRWDGR
jgi:uncharacterized protein (DUF885 family)